ncbi:uncharacterized protein [Physcomitrium patens]|uniref:uncharacterized protein n=1 Tax=Physcomitrium patens TaxID=3218 RepID=UPI003CCDB71A
MTISSRPVARAGVVGVDSTPGGRLGCQIGLSKLRVVLRIDYLKSWSLYILQNLIFFGNSVIEVVLARSYLWWLQGEDSKAEQKRLQRRIFKQQRCTNAPTSKHVVCGTCSNIRRKSCVN